MQGNPPQIRIWDRWWYRQNFLLLKPFLRLMWKFNESCCVNSRNSQNFLNNRNWPNSAPTLVFRRVLTKENSSLHLMKKDLRKHPAWGWIRVNTKIGPVLDVKVCYHQGRYGVERSWSNLYFETEQFLGFASWTESTNTWPKRQKKFLLQALRTEVQGYLSRRLNHDQSRL